jgi:hypothetical protein
MRRIERCLDTRLLIPRVVDDVALRRHFKSEKPTTEAVDGNRRRTANREGSCCPLGRARSAVMAKKCRDVREH